MGGFLLCAKGRVFQLSRSCKPFVCYLIWTLRM